MTNDDLKLTLEKMSLILTDYTLANGDEELQEMYITLLDRYVSFLGDLTITTLFSNFTDTDSQEEKDLYILILFDILEDRLKEVA